MKCQVGHRVNVGGCAGEVLSITNEGSPELAEAYVKGVYVDCSIDGGTTIGHPWACWVSIEEVEKSEWIDNLKLWWAVDCHPRWDN